MGTEGTDEITFLCFGCEMASERLLKIPNKQKVLFNLKEKRSGGNRCKLCEVNRY